MKYGSLQNKIVDLLRYTEYNQNILKIKKRSYRAMRNYADDLHAMPDFGAKVVIGGAAFLFYKKIHNINFFSDKDYIVFELENDKGVYIVVGKVGVSSDEEILENFHKAISLLGLDNTLQQDLGLFDGTSTILQ